ncbi:MAG: hypothetical protein JWQ58_1011 [Reyranella sp.]|nr:hypothetical protein [Reyranella sp.]
MGVASLQNGSVALARVERLETACHPIILQSDSHDSRLQLQGLLGLDVSEGLVPGSPAESLAKIASAQAIAIGALLTRQVIDELALRVATAQLCQTLTSMRGHLSDGHRLVGTWPRKMVG